MEEMNEDQVTDQQPKRRVPVLFIVIVLCIVLGVGFFVASNRGSINNQSDTSDDQTSDVSEPTSLTLIANIEEARVGDTVGLAVSADSDSQSISGYDILLQYDQDAFDFISAASADDDFSLFTHEADGYLSITAVKKLNIEEDQIFDAEELIQVNFAAKSQGKYSFEMVSSIGQESTKLVTDDTEIINPRLQGTTIVVK